MPAACYYYLKRMLVRARAWHISSGTDRPWVRAAAVAKAAAQLVCMRSHLQPQPIPAASPMCSRHVSAEEIVHQKIVVKISGACQ